MMIKYVGHGRPAIERWTANRTLPVSFGIDAKNRWSVMPMPDEIKDKDPTEETEKNCHGLTDPIVSM